MAGSYADATSYRMPIDRDGTVGFVIDKSGVLTTMTTAQLQVINNEASDTATFTVGGANAVPSYFGLLFPEARDIDAAWVNFSQQSNGSASWSVEVSADTTSGSDGTWTALSALSGATLSSAIGPVKPNFRTGVTSLAQTAMKGLRVRATVPNTSTTLSVGNLHVYGKPVSGANPNRLELWHATLAQRISPAYLDLGDAKRNATDTRTFRVKNLSSTLTASGVNLSLDSLTDASPTLLTGQHALSSDGTNFAQTLSLGNLAPGALSGTITLRRTSVTNAQLGLWVFRVIATATSWA